MTPATLALGRVSAGYGSVTVLRDVDLAVAPGEVVGLLGPNGAGKTTLLRVAAGLLAPQSGTVTVAGDDLTDRGPSRVARAGVCLIPEGRGVFPELTVRENLRLQIPPWGKGTSVDAALDVFPDLRDRLGQKAGTMSGGQQQMLALARCWLARPTCVLLDEVSMGLAPTIVDEIFEALGRLAADGVALLLVEQYVDRALDLADRIVVLDRGRITTDAPTADIDRDDLLATYLGDDIAAPTEPAHDPFHTPAGGEQHP